MCVSVYVCGSVCVFVCEREKERKREQTIRSTSRYEQINKKLRKKIANERLHFSRWEGVCGKKTITKDVFDHYGREKM